MINEEPQSDPRAPLTEGIFSSGLILEFHHRALTEHSGVLSDTVSDIRMTFTWVGCTHRTDTHRGFHGCTHTTPNAHLRASIARLCAGMLILRT
jgi:hypothetical protein